MSVRIYLEYTPNKITLNRLCPNNHSLLNCVYTQYTVCVVDFLGETKDNFNA